MSALCESLLLSRYGNPLDQSNPLSLTAPMMYHKFKFDTYIQLFITIWLRSQKVMPSKTIKLEALNQELWWSNGIDILYIPQLHSDLSIYPTGGGAQERIAQYACVCVIKIFPSYPRRRCSREDLSILALEEKRTRMDEPLGYLYCGIRLELRL